MLLTLPTPVVVAVFWYCPAVAVPSSRISGSILNPFSSPDALASSIASIAPFLLRDADSASAPVNDRLMPMRTVWSAARAAPARSAAAPAAERIKWEACRRVIMLIDLVEGPGMS